MSNVQKYILQGTYKCPGSHNAILSIRNVHITVLSNILWSHLPTPTLDVGSLYNYIIHSKTLNSPQTLRKDSTIFTWNINNDYDAQNACPYPGVTTSTWSKPAVTNSAPSNFLYGLALDAGVITEEHKQIENKIHQWSSAQSALNPCYSQTNSHRNWCTCHMNCRSSIRVTIHVIWELELPLGRQWNWTPSRGKLQTEEMQHCDLCLMITYI